MALTGSFSCQWHCLLFGKQSTETWDSLLMSLFMGVICEDLWTLFMKAGVMRSMNM